MKNGHAKGVYGLLCNILPSQLMVQKVTEKLIQLTAKKGGYTASGYSVILIFTLFQCFQSFSNFFQLVVCALSAC